MAQIVRAQENGWLVQLHVEPKFKVGPGDALYDIMHEDGMVETVRAFEFGVIESFDEIHIFSGNDNGAFIDIPVTKGMAMFGIVPVDEGREAGTIKGLSPRPTRVIANRRARALNLI